MSVQKKYRSLTIFITNNYKVLILLYQIDLENYDTRLLELDSCGESERTVFIMPPEMTDLPGDCLYSYKVKKYDIYLIQIDVVFINGINVHYHFCFLEWVHFKF